MSLQPVPPVRSAIGLHCCVGEHPGRRCGRGHGKVEVVRAVREADRCPDEPAVLLDLLGNDRVAVIGLRQEAAEFLFRIIDEGRVEQLALVGGEDRLVVGDQLREQAEHEQDHEDPERPVAAPVGLEVRKPPPVERRELDEALLRQGRRDGRRGRRDDGNGLVHRVIPMNEARACRDRPSPPLWGRAGEGGVSDSR